MFSCWQAPDRDSAKTPSFDASVVFPTTLEFPDPLVAILQMEGRSGTRDDDVEAVTGNAIKRVRRWHKIYERMGIVFQDDDDKTRITPLGRLVAESSTWAPTQFRRSLAKQAIAVLSRFQLSNPADSEGNDVYPDGTDIHPYWAVWKATIELDGRLHWDELNREIMRVLTHAELERAIVNIRRARAVSGYDPTKGGTSAFALRDRCYDQKDAPDGRDPDGQVRDQKATPWFRRAGFGGLLLLSPQEAKAPSGYWTIASDVRDLVEEAVRASPPQYRHFSTKEEWFNYYGALDEGVAAPPPQLAPTHRPLDASSAVVLAKPFVLLAGISGTGKTRFVREQARLSANLEAADTLTNYELVCVRPDWHEPSDLLGYVSRVAGERFVVTPFLRFIVKAWREAVAVPETLKLQPLEHITTFWLCLDEMNLAPVEQYFADFLSIVETRQWTSSGYSCDPILPIHKLGLSPSTLELLRKDLGLGDDEALWRRFSEHGIPLPPNLVVVGTVNMDETTHGFSRKVIDRAITLDFGVFFPNNFDSFFAPNVTNSRLQFPRWTSVTEAELAGVIADPGGARSLRFLSDVNSVLSNTPFELAFRALNELLVSLRAFAPKSEAELCAVWDDFVMTKVLPRLEGDGEKLRATNSGKEQASILTRLTATLAGHGLTPMAARPDLYRCEGEAPASVRMRSPAALARMQGRLLNHGFTSFWP